MRKINLSITGCNGRMGQQLIKTISKDKNYKIYSLTEYKIVKKKINGIKPQLNTEEAFKKTDVIIDFTIPKCTFEILKIASKLKKKGCYWYYWFYKNGRKIDTILFKKNSNFKSWKHESWNKLINVFN